MIDSYFLGMYWGVRQENLEVCSTKLYNTFYFLKEFDVSFKEWYKTNKPRKGQIVGPIASDLQSLKSLLIKGQNLNDLGGILEDLGYLVHVKSCKDYSKAHILSISCGSYFKQVSNSVTLNIGGNENYKNLMNVEVLKKLFFGLADIWHPKSGRIKCNEDELFSKTFLSARFDS
ncbi:MAG: hypothetical protein QM763_23555 [Agriterribacter sp.]